jgi:DNA replication protein DnaC
MSELARKLEQLQLTSVCRELDQILAGAAAKNLSHAQTVAWLADVELEGRRTRSIERRFRMSRLQAKIGIESFDFNHHKTRTQLKNKILRLLDLDFITQGTNLVIIGNPDPAT